MARRTERATIETRPVTLSGVAKRWSIEREIKAIKGEFGPEESGPIVDQLLEMIKIDELYTDHGSFDAYVRNTF